MRPPPDRVSAGVCVVVGGVVELVTAMTSVADGLEHADRDFVSSRFGGRYRAVCGCLVVPGSMVAPPGRRARGVCSGCGGGPQCRWRGGGWCCLGCGRWTGGWSVVIPEEASGWTSAC